MRPFTAIMAFAVLAGLAICSSAAYAQDGLNSTGNTLPIGAGGNVVMTVMNTGMVGIGTTNPHATLDVNGGVKIGYDTRACNNTAGSAKAGSLRFNTSTKIFEGCNGTAWGPLGGTDAAFNVVSRFTPQANTAYVNYTSGPLFLTTVCPNSPFSSGYMESVSYFIYGPNGEMEVAHGQIQEGGSDVNFSAAPSASAMVPAGYSWATTMACPTTATAASAYEVATCGSANGVQMTTAPTTAAQLCESGTMTAFADTFTSTLEQCTRGSGRGGNSSTFETTLYAGNFTWKCVDTYTTASCGTVTPTNTSVMPGECKPYTAPVKPPESSGSHGK